MLPQKIIIHKWFRFNITLEGINFDFTSNWNWFDTKLLIIHKRRLYNTKNIDDDT